MLPKINGIVRINTKEIKYLPNGNMVLKLNCVSSEKYKTQSGEQKENTTWIECVSFGKQAEVINNYFNEKDRIFIIGKLKQETWQDNNGNKRSKHVVSIDEFDFIESNKQKNMQEPPQGGGEYIDNRGLRQSTFNHNQRVVNVDMTNYDTDFQDEVPF